MLQNAPGEIGLVNPWSTAGSALLALARVVLSRAEVIGISESLLTFVEGAGGVLSFVEFRLPSECRVLESLVGTLAAVGVQILHIRVQRYRDHVNHRVRVAECDGSEVASTRRFEVQYVLSNLVARELENVRKPLAKSRPGGPDVGESSAERP